MERKNAGTSQPRFRFRFDIYGHWWAGMILAAVLVGGLAIWLIDATSDKVAVQAPTVLCAPGVASQLPWELVDAVKARQAQAKLDSFPNQRVIMSRMIADGRVRVDALTSFEPQYCGFKSNIILYNISNGPLPHSSSDYGKDVATPVRDGQPFNPGDDICIGNTPGTAQLVDGHIKMMIPCDRTYPWRTLVEEQPKLPPQ